MSAATASRHIAGRRPLVSGNWKMHHDHLQAIRTVQDLGLRIAAAELGALDVSVHPPFCDLRSVGTVLEDRGIGVWLGAQHCHFEDSGAFTGEVSPPMLARLGVVYVIVGHSERRQLFAQTDDVVAATLRSVLRSGMVPIVCVGETATEREEGVTAERLSAQTEAALGGLPPEQVAGLVVAYEPIWAIGTGRTATEEDAEEACSHIRAVITGLAGEQAAASVRIQYGGSVRPDNTAELMAEPDVDGLLVGGASLEAAKFAEIVRIAAQSVAAAR
ncbi:MAG TPA: triose-phosphate isomerase [Acidimicrobiales bacterium]|nr:triose-phosphate isomerase [Acidimicrobiales bacterium]